MRPDKVPRHPGLPGEEHREAEDIKKRWQEYTEELYKKDLHDPDNPDGVITDLEPDILECEVKWALDPPAQGWALVARRTSTGLEGCNFQSHP